MLIDPRIGCTPFSPVDPLAPSRLDELKKRFEENPRRFFAPLANEYRKAGDLDQAIALCQEHLDGQAGNMNGHVVYGQALFDAGRYDEAEATFGTALTLDPENLIALRHLGDIARTNHDAPKALDWYTRVLDADPRNDEILAFIQELKLLAVVPPPREPTPATPIVVESATPRTTKAVPETHDGRTIEITPVKRPSLGGTTPIAPIDPVPSPDAPKRMSLLDMPIDLGGVGDSGIGAGLDAMPAEPMTVPAAIELDDGLGWDMGSIDLTPSSGSASEKPAAPAETPQVFVTETMAELYLQQGFRDEALQVYRQLAEQNPNDASIGERIQHLESGDRASMSFEAVTDYAIDVAPGTDWMTMMDEPAAAVEPDAALAFEALPLMDSFAAAPQGVSTDLSLEAIELPAEVPQVSYATPTPVAVVPSLSVPPSVAVAQSARAFFASLAQRRVVRREGTPVVAGEAVPEPSALGGSIDGLFGSGSSDADDAMGRALATAVGSVDTAPIRGKPTQAAVSELTLDSVFRSESAMRSSGPVRQSSVLKFDQFFATEAPAEEPAAPAADARDAGLDSGSPTDDAQFNSWLQGLKDQ